MIRIEILFWPSLFVPVWDASRMRINIIALRQHIGLSIIIEDKSRRRSNTILIWKEMEKYWERGLEAKLKWNDSELERQTLEYGIEQM